MSENLTRLKEIREYYEEVKERLTPRESRVLELRFGTTDGKTHTREEVAEMFGVSCERIRQIESKALRKRVHVIRRKQLKDFLE